MWLWCPVLQRIMSGFETVSLAGTSSGHGINISDTVDDGVVVGGVEHGSPAHQSDRIAKGRLHYCEHRTKDEDRESCIDRPSVGKSLLSF